MRYKSNKDINVQKDDVKSYVWIYNGKKLIGTLMWHYDKKEWIFQKEKKKKIK